jgi:hypothetical protein
MAVQDAAGDAPGGSGGQSAGIPGVLEAWRAAERDLDRVPVGSAEWRSVHAEFVSLCASYQRLFQEKLSSLAERGVPLGKRWIESAGDARDVPQAGMSPASVAHSGFGEREWRASGPPEHHLVGPPSAGPVAPSMTFDARAFLAQRLGLPPQQLEASGYARRPHGTESAT